MNLKKIGALALAASFLFTGCAERREAVQQMLENQEISENLEGEFTDEEIAGLARDKLGYSLPGERIFVDITGK